MDIILSSLPAFWGFSLLSLKEPLFTALVMICHSDRLYKWFLYCPLNQLVFVIRLSWLTETRFTAFWPSKCWRLFSFSFSWHLKNKSWWQMHFIDSCLPPLTLKYSNAKMFYWLDRPDLWTWWALNVLLLYLISVLRYFCCQQTCVLSLCTFTVYNNPRIRLLLSFWFTFRLKSSKRGLKSLLNRSSLFSESSQRKCFFRLRAALQSFSSCFWERQKLSTGQRSCWNVNFCLYHHNLT